MVAAVCLGLVICCIGCTGMADFLQENTATKMITGEAENNRRQTVLLSDRLHLRAREYEKNGEIQSALLCWQLLSILNPADQDYADKFNRLLYESRLLAEEHFKKGKDFYQTRSYKSARKEFLTALRYNPDHAEALKYIKHKMTPSITHRYKIQQGDSLAKIAKKIYRDPNKYYLIAVYNNLDLNQQLVVGQYLTLPALEPGGAIALVDVSRELKHARQLFLNQEYEKVIRSASKILKISSSNPEAKELKNAALYQMAERYRKQRRYLESLDTLKKLDPRYKGVQEDIAAVKVLLKQQAEENYRIGINFFINEQFNQAIESWEKTLLQNPHHPKARQDIEKARRLLKKLKEVD
jgi:tetratricopeptide (TPR) repeat protein